MENPIDKDKTTENPSTLPYAHTVGGAVIKPTKTAVIKGRSLSAMHDQTNRQLNQIKKQIELLAHQAQQIQNRIEISEKIYQAEISFKPLMGHTYHLYEKESGNWVLSMVAPNEWGSKLPFAAFVSTVKLLSDHTWEVIENL